MSSDCAHHQVRRVRLRIYRRRAHGQERDADGEQAANRARDLRRGDRGSPRTASSALRRVWGGEAGARTLDGGGSRCRSGWSRTLAAGAAAEGEAAGAADGDAGAAASHAVSQAASRRDRDETRSFATHGAACTIKCFFTFRDALDTARFRTPISLCAGDLAASSSSPSSSSSTTSISARSFVTPKRPSTLRTSSPSSCVAQLLCGHAADGAGHFARSAVSAVHALA